MANVLDLRRRIRSVQNTKQITGAMKMVSAAKLRRAQERALAARPYTQMLVNVLKSLVSRAEIYDPVTGEPHHALLERRDEKNILLIVISGDKGFAGAFNANVIKTTNRFLEAKAGKNVDLIAIGRKGRDLLRRRFPYAQAGGQEAEYRRVAPVEIVGEQVGVLNKVEFGQARDLAAEIVLHVVSTVLQEARHLQQPLIAAAPRGEDRPHVDRDARDRRHGRPHAREPALAEKLSHEDDGAPPVSFAAA